MYNTLYRDLTVHILHVSHVVTIVVLECVTNVLTYLSIDKFFNGCYSQVRKMALTRGQVSHPTRISW